VIDAVEQLAPDGFDNVENVLSYSQREASCVAARYSSHSRRASAAVGDGEADQSKTRSANSDRT